MSQDSLRTFYIRSIIRTEFGGDLWSYRRVRATNPDAALAENLEILRARYSVTLGSRIEMDLITKSEWDEA